MTQHVHDLSVSVNISEVPVKHMDEIIALLTQILEDATAKMPNTTVTVDDGRRYCDDWAKDYGVAYN